MVPRSKPKGKSSPYTVKSLLNTGGMINGGGGETPDPTEPPKFKTKEEHDAYYRQLILERAKVEKPEYYKSYLGLEMEEENGQPLDENTLIAVMGGLPKWTPPKKSAPPANPTDWSKMDSSKTGYKPEGYRYRKNRPDKDSITNRRRRESGGKLYNDGGMLQGPSHEEGGIQVFRKGNHIAEVEGGERIFSVKDTNEIDRLVSEMSKRPSKKKAALLGKKVKKMVKTQEANEEDTFRRMNTFATHPDNDKNYLEIYE